MWEGEERYHPLVAMGLAEVTGFEPNPEQFEVLARRHGPYRYFPVFVGDGGPATFHVTRYPGCASLLEPDPMMIDLFATIGTTPGANFHVVHSETVQTKRLDDFGPELVIDLLKLDVQGSELDILRHGTGKLSETVVIESEVEFVPIYKNQALFGDIQCFLSDHGFMLHKMIDVAGRPFRPVQLQNPFLPISQMLWANAVFVRDFTKLERYTDEQLLKAAAILDVVYGSYDLAALLLAEHDRRNQSGLQPRYLGSLVQRQIEVRFLNVQDHESAKALRAAPRPL